MARRFESPELVLGNAGLPRGCRITLPALWRFEHIFAFDCFHDVSFAQHASLRSNSLAAGAHKFLQFARAGTAAHRAVTLTFPC